MAKKTWIKIKRGLLEPKHRRKLGSAWFLYFYMLDKTNWDDGIIYDWKDDSAAQDMDIPVATLRDHRRKLEDELYIKTTQKQYCLEIAITNWTNPREYSGQKYNEVQDDEIPAPHEKQGDEITAPQTAQGDTQGYTQGDTQGTEKLTPLHSIHRITLSQNHKTLIQKFVSISGVGWYPKNIIDTNHWNKTLAFLQHSGVTDEIMKQACQEMKSQGKTITDPESIIPACSILLRS